MKRGSLVIRTAVVIISVLMMMWYAWSRIINIGSLFGSAFFFVIALCAVFFDKIKVFLGKIRKKRALKVLTNILMCCGIAAVLHIIVISCLMISYANRQPEKDATLVVLGCQVNGDRPSLMLKKRIEAAQRYLEENPEALCVLSGGKGKGEYISEAQCMYDQLVKGGIDSGRLFIEDKSTNTAENIAYTYKIIEEKGLNKELAVVTDGFHEFRAAMIVEKAGLHCGAVPSETPFYLSANFTTREMIAITAELFAF